MKPVRSLRPGPVPRTYCLAASEETSASRSASRFAMSSFFWLAGKRV
jgi:hypothetical protein